MTQEAYTWMPIDKHEMIVKGEAILKAIEDELLPEHRGKAVAIDVDLLPGGDRHRGHR